jgi:hypothetical protein
MASTTAREDAWTAEPWASCQRISCTSVEKAQGQGRPGAATIRNMTLTRL